MVIRPIVLPIAFGLLLSCGGGGAKTSPGGSQAPRVVAVNPASVDLVFGATQVVSATLDGSPDANILWTCDGGTVAPAEGATTTFTAGGGEGAFSIWARYKGDTSNFAKVSVTVRKPPAAVVMDSYESRIPLNGGTILTARTVSLPSDRVAWQLLDPESGATITSLANNQVRCIPGPNAGSFRLRASSVDVPSVFADHRITVIDDGMTLVQIEELPTLRAGEKIQLKAVTRNHSDSGVAWKIHTPGTPEVVGTLSEDGWYTAPVDISKCPNGVTVIAVPKADPSGWGNSVELHFSDLAVTPRVTSMGVGASLAFSASINGTSATPHWQVGTSNNDLAGFPIEGVITQTGMYTAPESACRVMVFASPAVGAPVRVPLQVIGGGPFIEAGKVSMERHYGQALQFPDGRILLGMEPLSAQLEWLDPDTGKTQPAGRLLSMRDEGARMTLLSSGKVLVTGGAWPNLSTSAEVFDPSSGLSHRVGPMNHRHGFHEAVLLDDGKVLVAGGIDDMNLAREFTELFDPVSETFSPNGTMNSARREFTMTRLNDGRILIAGGFDVSLSGMFPAVSAEIYDPVTQLFSKTGAMVANHADHTATLLGSGQVLITGGMYAAANVAELFDPERGEFRLATDFMKYGRARHAAVALDDHRVLVAGGGILNESGACEVFDDRTGAFTFLGSLCSPRQGHRLLLVSGGRVLVLGGNAASIERWDPKLR